MKFTLSSSSYTSRTAPFLLGSKQAKNNDVTINAYKGRSEGRIPRSYITVMEEMDMYMYLRNNVGRFIAEIEIYCARYTARITSGSPHPPRPGVVYPPISLPPEVLTTLEALVLLEAGPLSLQFQRSFPLQGQWLAYTSLSLHLQPSLPQYFCFLHQLGVAVAPTPVPGMNVDFPLTPVRKLVNKIYLLMPNTNFFYGTCSNM